MHGAVRGSPLDPVQAGGGQLERHEQPIQVGDGAPADQRDRAAQFQGRTPDEQFKPGSGAHSVRMIRDVQQRTVHVQEQRPAIIPDG